LFHFAIVAWGLWTNRNKFTIEHKFPSSLIDVLYKIDMFLQKWGILVREDDRKKMEATKRQMGEWVQDFTSEARQQDFDEAFL
jgi:hypothetical protein